ncbi:IS3 family transposase, partial [Sporosarcina contaminans]
RRVIGWYMSDRMTKELVITALKRAIGRQAPSEDLIHHSDRGSQYASHDYQNILRGYRITTSMSRKGNCYDNACIESFHSIIKRELIYLETYKTRQQAKDSIVEYIECFYNKNRIHSTNDYLSPIDKEKAYYQCLSVDVEGKPLDHVVSE